MGGGASRRTPQAEATGERRSRAEGQAGRKETRGPSGWGAQHVVGPSRVARGNAGRQGLLDPTLPHLLGEMPGPQSLK